MLVLKSKDIKVDMGLLLELLILADQIRATIKKWQLIVSTISICEEGIKTKTAIVHCKNKNTSTRLKQWGTQDKQIDWGWSSMYDNDGTTKGRKEIPGTHVGPWRFWEHWMKYGSQQEQLSWVEYCTNIVYSCL